MATALGPVQRMSGPGHSYRTQRKEVEGLDKNTCNRLLNLLANFVIDTCEKGADATPEELQALPEIASAILKFVPLGYDWSSSE